jgi:hypothetical protein
LNLLFTFFTSSKKNQNQNQKIKKPKSQKKKKNLSIQLKAWALKLPSMKSPKLGAWAPNDSQSPQGPKPKSLSIHPILNGHDLQPLLIFKICIFKKNKRLWIVFQKKVFFQDQESLFF